MPLDKSGTKAAIGKNIKAEEAAGKPRKQAIAIALETDRRAGGDTPMRHGKGAKKGGRFAPASHAKRHPAARHY